MIFAQPLLLGDDGQQAFGQVHAACQVLLGCLQLVPLAQQITQPEGVDRAIGQVVTYQGGPHLSYLLGNTTAQ